MLVAQHLFGLKTLQQAMAYESAQDTFAQGGLCLVNGTRCHAGGGLEDDTRRGLRAGLTVGIALLAPRARHFLKHAIDCE